MKVAELNQTAVNRRRATAVGRKLSQVQTYVMGRMWDDQKGRTVVNCAKLSHIAVNRIRRTAVGRKRLSKMQTYVMGRMRDEQKSRGGQMM